MVGWGMRSCVRGANEERVYSYKALTFNSISGLELSSPMVGYVTAEEFHVISWSVSSNENFGNRTARTSSTTNEQSISSKLVETDFIQRWTRTHLYLGELEPARHNKAKA